MSTMDPARGVRQIYLYPEDGPEFRITIEEFPLHERRHTNLGFAVVKHGRTGSTLWRAAEGYVNGYALKDILWFILTREFGLFPKLCARRRERLWSSAAR
jgi:hypothetical protein